MGKGKVRKVTAAEKAAKEKAGKKNYAGGGAKGADLRKPKMALTCSICKAAAHSINIMKTHYEAKHASVKFDPAEYQ